jgi:hypothetical protein
MQHSSRPEPKRRKQASWRFETFARYNIVQYSVANIINIEL